LNTCGESAPGPDGISYNVYKSTWDISGRIIMDAWNHSIKIGQTSPSQRESVITLLEKEGKDKSNIINLRPISLSNCDIKICTKAIALRTNLVLKKLLNNTQTGYIPGRQITNNNRLIEEIIDMVNRNDDEAYLITLDAAKAFDSIDHDYLIEILQLYNFPKTYITWVKTIYCNLEASVLVNGYTTPKFKIKQSVKQGDALSCALFILAIEPLLTRIQNNTTITPITVKTVDQETGLELGEEIKKCGFADDITCLTKDKSSFQEIINEYENFSSFSGVHLNVNKTEVLVIGKKNTNKERFEILHQGKKVSIFDQEKVKICGITFSNDKNLAYESNIQVRIDKLKNQLNIWRQRNLTLEGKILIVKTFGLSQLIYALQSTFIKLEDIKLVDNIITKFIWNLKETNVRAAGKIKKTILNDTIENGGLNAPDIYALDKAIKYKSFLQGFDVDHPLRLVQDKYLQEVGFNFCNYSCSKIENNFIGKAIATHLENKKRIHADIKTFVNDRDGIHKNYYSYAQNKILLVNDFVNVRQTNMLTRLLTNNINTFQDLHVQRSTNSLRNLYLDVHQIYNSFPPEWRKLLGNTRRQHAKIKGEIYLDVNKWSPVSNITLKILTNSFRTKLPVDINEYLARKHEMIEVNNVIRNPFLVIRKTLKDVKIRNLCYKMYHNIYPTMHHLYKWKIKPSENCNLCNVKETLKHAIFDCPIARSAIHSLSQLINTKYNLVVRVIFTYENILFGLSSTVTNVCLKRSQKSAIDQVITVIKQKLILQRENKILINPEEINMIFEERMNLEKYIAIKNRNYEQTNRWGN